MVSFKLNKKKKHITIYDVAQELGVSTTTVSRALRDHHSIGRDTTRKVKKKAKDLGYEPNAVASNLRRKRTNTIGVIVSYINRPFISSLISGIEEVCNKRHYNVIISQSLDSYEKEKDVVKTMFNSRVDGMIVSLAVETIDYAHFNPFVEESHPLVFADRIALELNTDNVIIDNFESAYKATEHLIKQGYKTIGHLAGIQTRHVYQKRLEGYLAALKDYNIPSSEDLIYYSKLNFENGMEGAKSLLRLETRPDAVFAANDTSAIGFMHFAGKYGYAIPEDIGVIGFNNDPISSIIQPQLSTIAYPAIEIGKKAAEIVLDKISGKSLTSIPHTLTFNTELIVRESSFKKSNPSL